MHWRRDRKVMVSYSYREQEKDGKKVSLFTFRVWDGQAGKLKHSLGETEYPGYSMFEVSADGQLLVISQQGPVEVGGKIHLWDIEKGALLQTIEMDKERSQVKFAISPDHSTVAVGGGVMKGDKLQGAVWLFDTKTRKLKQKSLRDDLSEVVAVAFSADGKLLAAGGPKGEIVVWDQVTSQVTMSGVASQSVRALRFSPDSKQLISTGSEGDSGVLLWDLATGKSRELKGEAGGHELAFSPDGRFIAAVGRVQGDRTESWGLRVWDARSGEQLHEWAGWGWRGFAFSPDSKRLAVIVEQDTIKTMEIVKPAVKK
jgi:WD40 repeat protein